MDDMGDLNTNNKPDITPAQIGALLTALVGQLVAWGVVDNNRAQLVISIGTFGLGGIWKIVDAYLRGKRNMAHALATQGTTVVNNS